MIVLQDARVSGVIQFCAERQTGFMLCWASAVQALARFHGDVYVTQLDLSTRLHGLPLDEGARPEELTAIINTEHVGLASERVLLRGTYHTRVPDLDVLRAELAMNRPVLLGRVRPTRHALILIGITKSGAYEVMDPASMPAHRIMDPRSERLQDAWTVELAGKMPPKF